MTQRNYYHGFAPLELSSKFLGSVVYFLVLFILYIRNSVHEEKDFSRVCLTSCMDQHSSIDIEPRILKTF